MQAGLGEQDGAHAAFDSCLADLLILRTCGLGFIGFVRRLSRTQCGRLEEGVSAPGFCHRVDGGAGGVGSSGHFFGFFAHASDVASRHAADAALVRRVLLFTVG